MRGHDHVIRAPKDRRDILRSFRLNKVRQGASRDVRGHSWHSATSGDWRGCVGSAGNDYNHVSVLTDPSQRFVDCEPYVPLLAGVFC